MLLLREGMLVKSIEFKHYRPVGNPLVAIDYFNAWEVDEIVFLDILPGKEYMVARKDINLKNFDRLVDYTTYISQKCFVPLTVGGGIRTIEDIRSLLKAGADKVSINTQAVKHPEFITQAAKVFGRQCIVVSIDARKKADGSYEVFTSYGKEATGMTPAQWAKDVAYRGAGEILLQSMDKDGTLSGYDIDLIQSVTSNVDIPVIVCGGVGEWNHLVEGVTKGGADAVAAANIFHYTEHSTRHAKNFMRTHSIDVR